MWFRRQLFILLLMVMVMPVSGQNIYKRTDDFTGQTIYFTENREAKLVGGSFWSGRYVKFHFSAINATKPEYTISVTTHTDGWVFIKSGPSLILKVDGKFVNLSGAGSMGSRDVIYGSFVEETASYPMTLGQLQGLSKASLIEFRLVGDRQVITGSLSPETLSDLKFFSERAPILIKDTSMDVPEDVKTAKQSTLPVEGTFIGSKVTFEDAPIMFETFTYHMGIFSFALKITPSGTFTKASFRAYFLDKDNKILNPAGLEFHFEATDSGAEKIIAVPSEHKFLTGNRVKIVLAEISI